MKPQHILLAAEANPVVAVGDASLKGRRIAADWTQGGLETVQDVVQVTHRSDSPLLDKAHNLYLQLR